MKFLLGARWGIHDGAQGFRLDLCLRILWVDLEDFMHRVPGIELGFATFKAGTLFVIGPCWSLIEAVLSPGP